MPPGSWHLLCLCTRSQEFHLRLVDRSWSTKPPQRTKMRAGLWLSSHAPKRTFKARSPRSSTVSTSRPQKGDPPAPLRTPNNLNSNASSSTSHYSFESRWRHSASQSRFTTAAVPASSGRVSSRSGSILGRFATSLTTKPDTSEAREAATAANLGA